MNKEYYKEKAYKQISTAQIEAEVIHFICDNNIDAYKLGYDKRLDGDFISLYKDKKWVKTFRGEFRNLEVLKDLHNFEPLKDLSLKELEAICKKLTK